MKLLFLLFTTLKLGKILLTVGTMLLSVFAYSLIFGWRYAVGFVLLILVHEMGHYMAARQLGLRVGAPTFIPFVGAWINLKETPLNAEAEAYIGIAGPITGTIGALACYFAARQLDSQLLFALAYAGVMINLFNLIPLSPLDGGRIVGVLSPRLWWIGLPILAGLFLYRPSPLLVLIGVLALPKLMASFKSETINSAYYALPMASRLQYGAYYLGLAGFLAIMAYDLHIAAPVQS